ncbi:unnamed protein product [Parnassius mnemosyne]|uniref:HAT C-terminal dimerisation domain-containing protein n=1 Tax=Parnassius mnemosyne TaxID=213953 RepID=A0AAV1M354_9NEOP
MFDSSPDQAHREQMSELVGHVEFDFNKTSVRVRDSFLGFIQMTYLDVKDAGSLVDEIQLGKDDLDLQDCRSQYYENAAVMAGDRTGGHQRFNKDICELRQSFTRFVSIAGCERSFSKFKLIHSYLKTIMAQERLCNLAFLIVEREVTEITDLENNIDMFASRKVSNVQL